MEERRVHGAKELLSSIQLKSQSLYLGRIGCLRASEVTIGYVTSCLGFRKAKLGSWPVQCLPHAFLAQDSSHRVLQGIVMSYVILEVRQP